MSTLTNPVSPNLSLVLHHLARLKFDWNGFSKLMRFVASKSYLRTAKEMPLNSILWSLCYCRGFQPFDVRADLGFLVCNLTL